MPETIHKDDDAFFTREAYFPLTPNVLLQGKWASKADEKKAKKLNTIFKPEWFQAIADEYPGADVDFQRMLESHCDKWSPEEEHYGKVADPGTHGKLLLAVDPGTGCPLTMTELGDSKTEPRVRR